MTRSPFSSFSSSSFFCSCRYSSGMTDTRGKSQERAFLVLAKKCQDIRKEGWNSLIYVLQLGHVFSKGLPTTTETRKNPVGTVRPTTKLRSYRISLGWIREKKFFGAGLCPTRTTHTRVLKKKFRECSDESTPGTQSSSLFLSLLTVRR